ncbi:MAG: hypothetical protein ACUVTD_01205 [Nitrososphaerales archaeon]
MYITTHILTALMICFLLPRRFPKKDLALFALGSLLPDIDHLYMHRFLFYNIFFLATATIISRSQLLALGISLHLLEDFAASKLSTLFYPIAVVDLGLNQTWLYSNEVNLTVVGLFLTTLILRERLLIEKRSKIDLTRFGLMLIGSMAFAAGRLATVTIGYSNSYIIESGRFIGAFFLLAGAFMPYKTPEKLSCHIKEEKETTQMKKLLEWKPKIELKDGVKRYHNWVSHNKNIISHGYKGSSVSSSL